MRDGVPATASRLIPQNGLMATVAQVSGTGRASPPSPTTGARSRHMALLARTLAAFLSSRHL